MLPTHVRTSACLRQAFLQCKRELARLKLDTFKVGNLLHPSSCELQLRRLEDFLTLFLLVPAAVFTCGVTTALHSICCVSYSQGCRVGVRQPPSCQWPLLQAIQAHSAFNSSTVCGRTSAPSLPASSSACASHGLATELQFSGCTEDTTCITSSQRLHACECKKCCPLADRRSPLWCNSQPHRL